MARKHAQVDQPALVLYEATGGYERPLKRALDKAGIAQKIINPERVRCFARSQGVRAKTDPIDAQMLLAFAEQNQLRPDAPIDPNQARLATLLDRREHIVSAITQEKNRQDKAEPEMLKSIRRSLRFLQTELACIETAIDQHLAH